MISVLSLRFPGSRPRPVPWETATDAELAIAAKSRDRSGKEAFVEIVRRHQTAVCAVAYGVTGRIGLIDDIAQEAFLEAWKQMPILREPGKLKAWLAKIAHGCAVDALQRERPHEPLDIEAVQLTASGMASPDEAAADAEDEQLVWSALAELPEVSRIPLVLFYREGQSIAAVAATLDLSEDAVKQRLCRGREALRGKLAAKISVVAESKIAGVLGRVRPSTLLVVTVASAIGLLAAPAALAAGAFSAAGTASTGAASGGSAVTASTFSTAMTASSYLVAALTLAAFVPLGWMAREPSPSALPASAPLASIPPTPADPFVAFPGSELLKEWRRLHDEYGSDAAAMPQIYQAINAIKDNYHRRALCAALLAEWAVVDPQGGYQHLVMDQRNREFAVQFMREWLRLDPSAAAAHLAAHFSVAAIATGELLIEIAKVAPQHLAAIAAQLEPNQSNGRISGAFVIFAKSDPAAARAAAEALPDGPIKAAVLTGVAEGWAEKDGAAALQWAQSFAGNPGRNNAMLAALTGWARQDPVAALSHLDVDLSANGGADRVMREAAAKDFYASVRWMEQHPGKVATEARMGFTYEIAKRLNADPTATLNFLAAQPEGVRKGLHEALNSALLNDARAKGDAVRAWLTAQPQSEFIDGLTTMMLRITASRDFEKAAEWLAELPDRNRDGRQMEQRFMEIIDGGASLQEVDALLARLPESMRPPLLSMAFARGPGWGLGDLQPRIERAMTLQGRDRASALETLGRNIASYDPQAASAWAFGLTDIDDRRRAVRGVVRTWSDDDRFEASSFVAELPPGLDRDTAAAALVTNVTTHEPEAGWTWALSIADPALRLKSLQLAAAELQRRNPQSAQQIFQAANLSDAERAALLQVVRKPSGTR